MSEGEYRKLYSDPDTTLALALAAHGACIPVDSDHPGFLPVISPTFVPEVYIPLYSQLCEIRQAIQSMNVKPCYCHHETLVAQQFTRAQIDRLYALPMAAPEARIAAEQVLCPNRTLRPLCAHVGDFQLPDPFGEQIRQLYDWHILDMRTWQMWVECLSYDITRIDKDFNRIRFDIEGARSHPELPESKEIIQTDQNAREAHERCCRKLQCMQRALLRALDIVIKKVTPLLPPPQTTPPAKP